MFKKIILVLVVSVFLGGGELAYAGVVINEIVYAPTDGSNYEWIEIFNDSDEQINLDGWRFFNSESSSAPLRTSGSFTFEPHAYALITSNTSLVSFSGQIFTSSQFSLPDNSSKYNTYKGIFSDSNKTIGNSIIYDTSLGGSDGTSLSKINDLWKSGIPTPGAINQTSANNSSSSDTNTETIGSGNITTSSTTSVSSEPKPKTIENPTMKVKILANTLAFAGEPLEIKTDVTGYANEKVVLGRAYWNFGDGGSLEQINNFEKFSHTYYYPGEYVLFLEYYQNSFSKIPEATSKMIIKVLATTVIISKVGDAKDFFIELSNNASSDIDISNWFIQAGGKTFVLPKNSVIMSKKQMTISGKITGFIYGDQSNLKLYSGTGELVFDYSSPIEPVKILAKNSVPVKISTALQSLGEAIPPPAEQIPAEDLLATPAGAQVSVFPPLIIPLASLAFIGGSAGAVYFIRRKKIIPQTGNDFEILDE